MKYHVIDELDNRSVLILDRSEAIEMITDLANQLAGSFDYEPNEYAFTVKHGNTATLKFKVK